MPVTYTMKWVPDGGPTYYFVAPYATLEAWDGDKFTKTIPSAQSQGAGEYAERSLAEPRMVSIRGKVIGSTPDDFKAKWQALSGALGQDTFGRLYKDSDSYLICQCDSVAKTEEDKGLTWCNWTATFRVSDPLFYSETAGSQNLSVGTTAMAIGGTYKAPVKITLNVNSIGTGGKITVTHTYNGSSESFVLTPTATGIVTIDGDTGDILRAGAHIDSEFTGCVFEEIEPSGATITIALSNGATLSAASASWIPRSVGA